MILQQMKPGARVIPHFHVILTGKSISSTIFMTQGFAPSPVSFSFVQFLWKLLFSVLHSFTRTSLLYIIICCFQSENGFYLRLIFPFPVSHIFPCNQYPFQFLCNFISYLT